MYNYKYVVISTRKKDNQFDCVLNNKIYNSQEEAMKVIIETEEDDRNSETGMLYDYLEVPVW
jgi:hypothetical protein